MQLLRDLYNKLIPKETRFWFYKLRHRQELEALKTKVHPSAKGDFSLRRYVEHQCVFVHVTKAAGTSLALSLFGELPYHYTAQEYRVIYGRRDFNRFFKFTFVRNPWDRLYSAYAYLKGGGWNSQDAEWAATHLAEIDSFDEFVMKWLTPERLHAHIHLWPQCDFVCDRHGKPIIDHLGYFETIQQDFDFVCRRLQLPQCDLKHTNSSKRAGYQDVYSQAAIEKVARLYAQDIANFGYRFTGMNRMQVAGGRFVSAH